MKFLDWWSRQNYWKKGFYLGLLIGFLKLPFFMIFGEILPNWIFKYAEIPDKQICDYLNLGDGEPCGFFFFYYSSLYNPIFYGLLGILIGFIIEKFKSKNDKTKPKILPKK